MSLAAAGSDLLGGVDEERQELILVADDDPDIARFVEMSLKFEGYAVVVAHDGIAALAGVTEHRPDLVILDVMMPRLDGVEVTRRLRADPMTAATPVIMLTAKGMSADRVEGLTAGADDYLVKPFDTAELTVRVRATLRRNREMREVSPLTGLPGNTRILQEIARRLAAGVDTAVGYIDIDRFKSFNDAYGFLRGDELITLLARCLHRALAGGAPAAGGAFLGHVGGDDFLLVCPPAELQRITDVAIAEFERRVVDLYDPADAERGFLELTDRRGRHRRFPLVTVSVGVALSTRRRFRDPREVIAVATEMKGVAKARPGSYVAVDRRTDRM